MKLCPAPSFAIAMCPGVRDEFVPVLTSSATSTLRPGHQDDRGAGLGADPATKKSSEVQSKVRTRVLWLLPAVPHRPVTAAPCASSCQLRMDPHPLEGPAHQYFGGFHVKHDATDTIPDAGMRPASRITSRNRDRQSRVKMLPDDRCPKPLAAGAKPTVAVHPSTATAVQPRLRRPDHIRGD